MKHAAELIIKVRSGKSVEVLRPSDILTVVANALCEAADAAARDSNMGPVKIGRYYISLREGGKVWIEHDAGDGMEFDEIRMKQWLDKLWDEEF